MSYLSPLNSTASSLARDPNHTSQNEAGHKKRTRCSSTHRPYVCGCGKSYQSYPAIYTHAKNKHGGRIMEGSYHLKNGDKRAIKSSKSNCTRTGLKKTKSVASRIHSNPKFAFNQKIKEHRGAKALRTNLQIAPIEHKSDTKSKKPELGAAEILRPTIYSLLEQNGLKRAELDSKSIGYVPECRPRKPFKERVIAVLEAFELRANSKRFCSLSHLADCLVAMINEQVSGEHSPKQQQNSKARSIYELLAKFLVFINDFLGEDAASKVFMKEMILMICLLCHSLNLYGSKEDPKCSNIGKQNNQAREKQTVKISHFEAELRYECKAELDYCAQPASKLSILTKLMPRFLALYFPYFWSQLLM